jgi:hypothetical protein
MRLATIECLVILDKIMLQLIMHLLVPNRCMGLDEGLDPVAIMCRLSDRAEGGIEGDGPDLLPHS